MARQIVFHPQQRIGHFSLPALKKWGPAMGLWGVGIGVGVAYFMAPVPKFKRDVLLKIPLLSHYFEDHTPASDKSF